MIIQDEYINWLMIHKGYSKRSARDLMYRLNRILGMLGGNTIDDTTYHRLQNIEEFKDCSITVKSQLKKSIILYIEFQRMRLKNII